MKYYLTIKYVPVSTKAFTMKWSFFHYFSWSWIINPEFLGSCLFFPRHHFPCWFFFWAFFNQIYLSFLDFQNTRIKQHWGMFQRQTSLFRSWCLSCTSQIVTKHQYAHSWVIQCDETTYLSPKFCLLSPETLSHRKLSFIFVLIQRWENLDKYDICQFLFQWQICVFH